MYIYQYQYNNLWNLTLAQIQFNRENSKGNYNLAN